MGSVDSQLDFLVVELGAEPGGDRGGQLSEIDVYSVGYTSVFLDAGEGGEVRGEPFQAGGFFGYRGEDFGFCWDDAVDETLHVPFDSG